MTHIRERVSQQFQLPLDLQILRWSCLCCLLLVAATHALWQPPLEFPGVPVTAWFAAVSPIWDWIGLACLVVALTMLVIFPRRSVNWPLLLTVVSGVGLVLLNQHRLQPWFYQMLILAGIFLLSGRLSGRATPDKSQSTGTMTETQFNLRLIRGLVISIYLFSAIGKLDYEFLHTVGQQFLAASMQFVDWDTGSWSESSRTFATLAFPTYEMLVGVMLIPRTTRRAAGVLACGLHCGLMAVLGPWGLNHSAGVVLWNLQFAVQAVLLFVWPASTDGTGTDSRPETHSDLVRRSPREERQGFGFTLRRWLATSLVSLLIILPLLERWGWWDHWLSWALYAPHSSRVQLYVARTAVDQLPDDLLSLIREEDRQHLWVRIPLGQWSLEQLDTPLYPQARFQLGVAKAVARQFESNFAVRCVVQGPASRWDGSRRQRELEGKSEIDSFGPYLLLDCEPRWFPNETTDGLTEGQ